MTAREYVELVKIRDELKRRAHAFLGQAEMPGTTIRTYESGLGTGYEQAWRDLSTYLLRIEQPGGIV